MSTGDKRPPAQAREDAEAFRAMFDGCYEQWTVAGSVRRGKPEVGDIEHVVIPRIGELTTSTGLYRENGNLLIERANVLVRGGKIQKALYNGSTRWGDLYRGCVFRDFKHEIFSADALNFGPILAIRTGPAEFSERLVTRLKARGEYRQHNGYVVKVLPEERTFLELCGEPWTEPGERR